MENVRKSRLDQDLEQCQQRKAIQDSFRRALFMVERCSADTSLNCESLLLLLCELSNRGQYHTEICQVLETLEELSKSREAHNKCRKYLMKALDSLQQGSSAQLIIRLNEDTKL